MWLVAVPAATTASWVLVWQAQSSLPSVGTACLTASEDGPQVKLPSGHPEAGEASGDQGSRGRGRIFNLSTQWLHSPKQHRS